MEDMTIVEFNSLMRKVGFSTPRNRKRVNFVRLCIVIATGLMADATMLLEQGEDLDAIDFERRAEIVIDYLSNNGYLDPDKM